MCRCGLGNEAVLGRIVPRVALQKQLFGVWYLWSKPDLRAGCAWKKCFLKKYTETRQDWSLEPWKTKLGLNWDPSGLGVVSELEFLAWHPSLRQKSWEGRVGGTWPAGFTSLCPVSIQLEVWKMLRSCEKHQGSHHRWQGAPPSHTNTESHQRGEAKTLRHRYQHARLELPCAKQWRWHCQECSHPSCATQAALNHP